MSCIDIIRRRMNEAERTAASASMAIDAIASILCGDIKHKSEVSRRVLNTRATGPDWQEAHRVWLNAAELLAVAIIHQAEQEARQ